MRCLPLSLSALFALGLALSACNCGTSLGSVDGGVPDAGPQLVTCADATECPVDAPECSFGVCKRPCASSSGCNDPNTYCNVSVGYCEPGCRDSSTCPNGEVCSAGVCIVSAGCATKCDCEAGQVCAAGACADPPESCNNAEDCGRGADAADECNDFACNGFTHLCFDPDPTPCVNNGDCTGRPGCAGGCVCTGGGNCVPSVDCTVDDEADTCGDGFFCDTNGGCQALPACTNEADCGPQGLTCNLGRQQCERPRQCTGAADCTVPPTTYCNTTTGFCAQPLCNNGGITCDANEQCTPDGRCVPLGTGDACTSDASCPTNQYCAVVQIGQPGNCAVGCRDNSSCQQAGQTCNGAHQCVGGGGGGGQGDPCANANGEPDDSLCAAGLFCGTITGTCQEGCDPSTESDCATDGCCQLTGSPCCVDFFGFIGVCQSSGC